MTVWTVTNAIAAALMPPGSLLVLLIAGLLLLRHRRRLATGLIAAATASLYVLSTPYVGTRLLASLEPPYTDPAADGSGQAIVVLGGGRYDDAPEYDGDTVGGGTLARLRYGARLHRATGKPVAVTGGSPRGGARSEAELMKAVLERDFDVPVRWVEGASNTTYENALFTHRTLSEAGIRRIYLVTHAWHMPRSVQVFGRAGFEVIPAPTHYTTPPPRSVVDFLPDAGGLQRSAIWGHEVIGMVWYRLKSIVSTTAAATP
jgi:uncharacterized SAM-binding protein YcdF (DUF218 family)